MSIEQPDPRAERRKDPTTRDRIASMEAQVAEIHRSYDAIRRAYLRGWWRTRGVLALLFVATVGLGLGQLSLANDNSQRITDIQNSRLQACNETNSRHAGAVVALNALLEQERASTRGQLLRLFALAGVRVAHPVALVALELASIKASYTSTLALINALDPYRDCKVYVGLASPQKARKPSSSASGSGSR